MTKVRPRWKCLAHHDLQRPDPSPATPASSPDQLSAPRPERDQYVAAGAPAHRDRASDAFQHGTCAGADSGLRTSCARDELGQVGRAEASAACRRRRARSCRRRRGRGPPASRSSAAVAEVTVSVVGDELWITMSSPSPPSRTSLPAPPMSTSSPAPPSSTSSPAPPMSTSSPSPPSAVSWIAPAASAGRLDHVVAGQRVDGRAGRWRPRRR